MERYQVILAYDGSRFKGFQRQAGKWEALTVQDVVEKALRQLGWQGSAVLVAGRTDSGVHATGQVIAFDLEWRHSLDDLRNALNANLPLDLAARAVKLAPPTFHPRYDALDRRYQYRLFSDEVRHPLRERYAWRVSPAVSLEPMQQATSPLLGTHDFSAFGTSPRSGGTTVRTITHAAWQGVGNDLVFEITGNAFLYHMVRRLVYLLVKIGQGEAAPEIVSRCLEGEDSLAPRGIAPPQGCTLVEVRYS
jgi:tRNA pseudouridine38-40 synthase